MSLEFVRVAALAWCSALLLVGCGGGNDGNGNVGLEGKFFYQMDDATDEGMTLELQKTGIAIATRPGGTVQQGTYQMEGDKVTVTLEGAASKLIYTLADDGNLKTTFYGTEEALFLRQ